MRLGEGFALYLVALRSPGQRAALVDALRAAEGLCVGFVDAWALDREGAELLGERERALACGPGRRPVLIVEGVDGYRRQAPEFFGLLNRRRNLMLRATTAAVVFVGEAQTIQALRREAPDMWSVRAADLELDVPLPPVDWAAPDYPSTGLRERFSPPRLTGGTRKLFGRDAALARLDRSWDEGQVKVLTLVAWGGVGKTSLIKSWRDALVDRADADAKTQLDAVFEWSFYSQGVRDKGGASADFFIREALVFFGERALADSAESQLSKGARLAEVVGEQRALLILDGLEPLQRADGSLREPGVAELLERLARRNRGLCVVTTRVWPPELDGCSDQAAPRWDLDALDEADGADLLEYLLEHGARPRAVTSTEAERREISRAVQGHPLTLQLLGSYIREVHGDVRGWREVELRRADDVVQGGHAFRVMDAYVRWLEAGGEDAARELAALRLLGLFDRGATPGSMAKLREAPAIAGLTEALVGLDREGWARVVSGLERRWLVARREHVAIEVRGYDVVTARIAMQSGLLEAEPRAWSEAGPSGELLDAHPLVREYFGRALMEHAPDSWREAHRRLFEWLQRSVPYWPEGAEGLQPLYQAVVHGCAAGLVQETCATIYRDRILRGASFYGPKQLGGFSAELGALANFFDSPWSQPSQTLDPPAQAWLLNSAGLFLLALGRLNEALEPMRAGLERDLQREDWDNAATAAANLSTLELVLGHTRVAASVAEQALAHARRSADDFLRVMARSALAHARHQSGEFEAARADFEAAERTQAQAQPSTPLLSSVQSHLYTELLLMPAERAAWRGTQVDTDTLGARCTEVFERASQALTLASDRRWLLDIGLDHLTLGRAALYATRLGPTDTSPSLDLDTAREHLDLALAGLRKANQQSFLPPALLTRAWLHCVEHQPTAALGLLDEAERIASRGPMPLHLADVHLYRARLFRERDALAKARALIERHQYGRRVPELEDAERDAATWPAATPTPKPPPKPSPAPVPARPDLAILIALPEELDALARDYALDWDARPNPTFPGSDFFFTGPKGYRCVVTLMPRMGPTPAAQVALRLLAHKPATIINVGIAGGLKSKDLRIGDVIVPRQVDAYDESAKIEGAAGRWQRRSSSFRPSASLLADIIELSFRADARAPYQAWLDAGREQLAELRTHADPARVDALLAAELVREQPKISTAHLASGSFVVASQAFAAFIREANADIYAVEMEAAGMMAATEYQREQVEALIVRGISDHVDADKAELDALGDGALRQLAMDNAWRLVSLLMALERLPRSPSGTD